MRDYRVPLSLPNQIPLLKANSLPTGVVCHRRFFVHREDNGFIYVPQSLTERAAIFISVHGISRNAVEHAQLFAPIMDRLGMVLLAPVFSEHHYPRYQRLGGGKRGLPRADQALTAMVGRLQDVLGMSDIPCHLFGFSGGGQFAHRFAMAYPRRIASYVVAAAGWYTMPDTARGFPRGVGYNRHLPDIRINLKEFMTIPSCVIVGERDTRPGSALNQSRGIVEEQGTHRLQRGENWVQSMQRVARSVGLDDCIRFVIAPRSGHSFRTAMCRGGMGEIVYQHICRSNTGT